MEPKRVHPLEGVFAFISTIGEQPVLTANTELDGIVVDTCLPADTKIYETGIRRDKIEGIWVIVEQYENEDKAKEGHERWVKLMTEYPDYPLKDIDNWGLDEWREELG